MCAESRAHGKCPGNVTLPQAQRMCASLGPGSRLCTQQELELDEAAGSGCHLDYFRVWSSTPCPAKEANASAGGVMTLGGGLAEAARIRPQCSSAQDRFPARCCASGVAPPGIKALPNLPPRRTCEELGWTNEKQIRHGSPKVCAQSEVGAHAECVGPMLFDAAQALCAHLGARLCSAEELGHDEAKGSGCHLDTEVVWSSSEVICPDGQALTSRGARRKQHKGAPPVLAQPPLCTFKSESHFVRCCSDVDAQLEAVPHNNR